MMVRCNNNNVGVIIPAFNEERRIESTICALKNVPEIKDILVIDDGSTDQTSKIAELAGARVYRLDKNYGKGYALETGIQLQDNPIIIFLDGDLGESAQEVTKLLNPILKDEADVTVAKIPFVKNKGGFGFVKRLSISGIRKITGKHFSSVLSGQRAFKKDVMKIEYLQYPRFGIEFGMTIDLLCSGVRIQEVDVNMKHRITGKNFAGFIHRAKQFKDISHVFIKKMLMEGR